MDSGIKSGVKLSSSVLISHLNIGILLSVEDVLNSSHWAEFITERIGSSDTSVLTSSSKTWSSIVGGSQIELAIRLRLRIDCMLWILWWSIKSALSSKLSEQT